jgi:hypothetical protein
MPTRTLIASALLLLRIAGTVTLVVLVDRAIRRKRDDAAFPVQEPTLFTMWLLPNVIAFPYYFYATRGTWVAALLGLFASIACVMVGATAFVAFDALESAGY